MNTQTGDKEKSNVFLYDRNKLTVTGVKDVSSFDENSIVLGVSDGSTLTVEGSSLNITVLDMEKGCVEGTGYVSGFFYSDGSIVEKSSILSRIFRGK